MDGKKLAVHYCASVDCDYQLLAAKTLEATPVVRVGIGRDAADAAVASIFGGARCRSMTVDCQLAPGQQFKALGRRQLGRHAVELDP